MKTCFRKESYSSKNDQPIAIAIAIVDVVVVSISMTRLGDFWKFLATNAFSRVAQKDCWLLGYFENNQLTAADIIWATFKNNWETFIIQHLVTLVSMQIDEMSFENKMPDSTLKLVGRSVGPASWLSTMLLLTEASTPVWPVANLLTFYARRGFTRLATDVEISSPYFPKSSPKSSHTAVLLKKFTFSKLAQKSQKIGCLNICRQEHFKNCPRTF